MSIKDFIPAFLKRTEDVLTGFFTVNSREGPDVILNAGDLDLENVDNTSDLNKPISVATQEALDLKEPFNNNIQAHISNTNNPHDTTASQVGLNNVDNTSDTDKPVSTAQQTTFNSKMNLDQSVPQTISGGIPIFSGIKSSDNIILNKAPGFGLKVDTAIPTFGWRDIIGFMLPDTGGANAPTLSTFRGGLIRRFAYSATDKMDCEFHIPHDYVPGTDVFIHIHWGHNGTAISGNLVVTFAHTYAKGHNQQIFPVEKSVVLTYATTNIATTPRWIHRIDEVQLSSNGGSATLMDSAQLEPDGIIGVDMTVTTIPTITGGAPNEPFIFFCDLHYQSTGIPTKQKAPNFYV